LAESSKKDAFAYRIFTLFNSLALPEGDLLGNFVIDNGQTLLNFIQIVFLFVSALFSLDIIPTIALVSLVDRHLSARRLQKDDPRPLRDWRLLEAEIIQKSL
jgi:hypothetical protein